MLVVIVHDGLTAWRFRFRSADSAMQLRVIAGSALYHREYPVACVTLKALRAAAVDVAVRVVDTTDATRASVRSPKTVAIYIYI